MKKKVIKGQYDWPEQAIKDLQRIGEGIEAIIEGENETVVTNILINLLLQSWIHGDNSKDDIMNVLSEAYDMIEKQKQVENENKRA